MRSVTRNFLLGMAAVVVLLLALGALPGFLKSGDPYYLTATPVENETVASGSPNASVANASAVAAANLSERRYPYTMAALDNATADATGQSNAYYRGPVGLKGAFTHSPFDELDALTQQFTAATDGVDVVVRHDGSLYRLAVTQQV
jgi:hypothetical protein